MSPKHSLIPWTLILATCLSSEVFASDEPEPPPCAGIQSVVPAQTSPLGGEQISLFGFGLSGVSAVWVDGDLLASSAWFAVSGSQLVFTAPPADALGDVTIQIACFGGFDTDKLTYVAPPAPVLLGPETFVNGEELALAWSAQPAQTAYLLLDTSGQTIDFHGQPVIVYQLLFPQAATDSQSGLGDLDLGSVMGLPVGLEVFIQIVTVAPGGGSATIQVSNILTMDVIG
jgi:hypothetical protein